MVVCLVTCPLCGSKGGVDFVFVQASLLFMFKCQLMSKNDTIFI